MASAKSTQDRSSTSPTPSSGSSKVQSHGSQEHLGQHQSGVGGGGFILDSEGRWTWNWDLRADNSYIDYSDVDALKANGGGRNMSVDVVAMWPHIAECLHHFPNQMKKSKEWEIWGYNPFQAPRAVPRHVHRVHARTNKSTQRPHMTQDIDNLRADAEYHYDHVFGSLICKPEKRELPKLDPEQQARILKMVESGMHEMFQSEDWSTW